MSIDLRAPGGDRTWTAGLLLLGGLYLLGKGLLQGGWMLVTLGVITLIVGAGLWRRQQWARLTAVLIAVLLGIANAWLLFSSGFGWWRLLLTVGTFYTAWSIWREFAPEEEGDEPMVSLVLFLREPRFLEDKILAQIVSSAWGEPHGTKDDSEEKKMVLGASPIFMIPSDQGMFIVHNHDRQYFDDSQAAAEATVELRLRKVIEDHQGWMSVDLLGKGISEPERREAYRKIALLIAELSGPDCLAIYQPESGKINVWNDELEAKLRGPNALEEFSEPVNAPVIQVADDDPKMKAAVAEARERWPEFVAAFKAKAGENFSVKAPVAHGEHREFIWLNVIGLEPEFIHGTLANDPVDLGKLKLGDQVEVAVADLNDWVFIRDGEPAGLFTVKVLMELQKKLQSPE